MAKPIVHRGGTDPLLKVGIKDFNLKRKGGYPYYYFSRQRQIAVKIKPLYLSMYLRHYACYLTSNTTRVVQQHQILIFK